MGSGSRPGNHSAVRQPQFLDSPRTTNASVAESEGVAPLFCTAASSFAPAR
jgi:hypothetical protein